MNKISLFVFIDGFGWELLRQHPFLDDVLTLKAPLETVFGYSCTCIPTILTGKLPREHGHLSFFRYGPDQATFDHCRMMARLPDSLMGRARVRRVISRILQKMNGFTGYFQIYNVPFQYLPLFDYTEKRDLYQPGGINNGIPTIFDHLRAREIPFHMSDWRASEQNNVRALKQALDEGTIEFAYLYFAAMDGLLHSNGTRSPRVAEKIRWYERQLRDVIDQAHRKYDTVQLYLFSDHGMTDVTEECDLIAQIEKLGLRFGVDYAAMYDSTMARFWFLRESARRRIVKVLEAESRGHILSEEQLEAYGCNFADHAYGELFFLLEPGVLLCPSFMGQKRIPGMHGYAPEDRNARAIFCSNVEPDPIPKRLDGLFDLMVSTVAR